MNVRDRMMLRYLDRLLGSAAGRAHLLNQGADAEANGENQVFEHVLSHVDDPQLRKLVEKHQADEIRHEQLFRACLARTGESPGPVPSHLKLIDRLNDAVGGYLSKPIVDGRGVMEAYVMLQVIEERAVTQFALFEAAFRPVDAATADVFAEVARDEARHLKYCQAISRRYAPGDATLAAVLTHYRDVEARCFAENSDANMDHVFSHGLFQASRVEKSLWRALQWWSARSSALPVTAFYGQPLAA